MAWNDKMTAFFRGNAIDVLMSHNDVPSHLMVCAGKIRKHGGTFGRNRRQKGAYAQVEKILSGTFQEADYLGLADIPVGSNLKLTFEETVRSKRTYLRKANAVL